MATYLPVYFHDGIKIIATLSLRVMDEMETKIQEVVTTLKNNFLHLQQDCLLNAPIIIQKVLEANNSMVEYLDLKDPDDQKKQFLFNHFQRLHKILQKKALRKLSVHSRILWLEVLALKLIWLFDEEILFRLNLEIPYEIFLDFKIYQPIISPDALGDDAVHFNLYTGAITIFNEGKTINQ